MTILGPKLVSSETREGFLGSTIDSIFWQVWKTFLYIFHCSLLHCLGMHLYSEHTDKIMGHALPSPHASSVPWRLVNVIFPRLWASKWAGRSVHFKVNIRSYSGEIPVSLPRDFCERRGRHINWKICHLKGKYRSELVITGIWAFFSLSLSLGLHLCFY